MAATAEVPTLLELRQLRPELLRPLLQEETEVWLRDMLWDFRPSSELVRRFVGMQALNGHALCWREEVVGYAYFVCEEHKGLIGDLYVKAEVRTPEAEARLLEASVRTLLAVPHLRRVESQLMLMSRESQVALPFPDRGRAFARDYMVAHLAGEEPLREDPRAAGARFELWSDAFSDQAAHLIAEGYQGHVDADINDQYRTVPGAKRFLHNIVQYPGCGSFFQPASFACFDKSSGNMTGVCLTSLIAFDTGHVTQVCVHPAYRGLGLGYEMMRRSLAALRMAGCQHASLTVTSSNTGARSLYERIGFATRRVFNAMVWEL
ncbi:MAG: GNAT family N-acetyltransferase [Acidobacteria bacterium]|nr:GNAT family N-acetyltransferase [Acidobacteriota bacterium]